MKTTKDTKPALELERISKDGEVYTISMQEHFDKALEQYQLEMKAMSEDNKKNMLDRVAFECWQNTDHSAEYIAEMVETCMEEFRTIGRIRGGKEMFEADGGMPVYETEAWKSFDEDNKRILDEPFMLLGQAIEMLVCRLDIDIPDSELAKMMYAMLDHKYRYELAIKQELAKSITGQKNKKRSTV